MVSYFMSHSTPYRHCFSRMVENKAAELLRYGRMKEGCISLAQGEGNLPTPAFICDAAAKALADGKTFYGLGLGIPELRQEISEYQARIYGQTISTDRIYVTSSGTHAVHLALMSILEDDDEVVAITPIWKHLIGSIELVGGKLFDVAMEQKDGAWFLDLNKLFAKVTPSTKAIMIVSPNNPTGWVMPEDDIKAILEFARARGIWIIADEVYGRTTHDSIAAPSFLDYATEHDRLYVINSFSKAWAMTGWRLGWLIGPKDAEERIRDVILYETMGTPVFSQQAAIQALRLGEDFIHTQKALWKSNQDLVVEKLGALDRVSIVRAPSAFYAFFKVVGEDDSYQFVKKLIDEAGVSLAPGAAFGAGFHDYLRLCFATDTDIVDAAVERILPFLR